jgi:hypothetical protein
MLEKNMAEVSMHSAREVPLSCAYPHAGIPAGRRHIVPTRTKRGIAIVKFVEQHPLKKIGVVVKNAQIAAYCRL